LKIVKSPYLSEKSSGRFWWNLVHYIRYWTRLQSRDKRLKFLKFKMAAAVILKFAFLSTTHRPVVRFQRQKFRWNRMRKQNGRSTRATWQKLQICKTNMADRRHFEKSLNCHISVKNRPILMKYGTLHQILILIFTVMWRKIAIFEIRNGGSRHLKNRFFLAITHLYKEAE